MCKQLQIELETERRIAQSRGLSAFHRNGTTWELLLLLAVHDGQSDLGVYNTLDQLETGYLGQSAMLKFLRDRRSDGLLAFDEHEKRSKWRIRLARPLYFELIDFLSNRNDALNSAFSSETLKPSDMNGGKGISASHPLARATKQ